MEHLVGLAEVLAWPAIALIVVFLFRGPLTTFIKSVSLIRLDSTGLSMSKQDSHLEAKSQACEDGENRRVNEQVAGLDKLRIALAGHIGRQRRGVRTTASIGPGGHLRGECARAARWFSDNDLFAPPLEDAFLVKWHDLLSEIVPMLERGVAISDIREKTVLVLTKPTIDDEDRPL